jgi:uncharacterized protein YjbI with pentapeptide repeats
MPGSAFASSDNDTGNAPPPTLDGKAIGACSAAAQPNSKDIDDAEIAARLQKPDSRIEEKDWSGQDLSGRNFSGKALVNVKLKGAILRDADFTDAIICESDLTNADLTGAHLVRAVVASSTEINGANLSNVSARGVNFADASGTIKIDGADLRDASTLCDELPQCLGSRVEFSSLAGADLRGASIGNLCCALPGLDTAKLDGVITYFNETTDGVTETDLAQMATGVGNAGHITFMPAYGQSGARAEFTGPELRQLVELLGQMHRSSAHPSFDCTRADSDVEKAVCADPRLAALDKALSWLWERVAHTPQQMAEQKKWLAGRATCPSASALADDELVPGSFGSPTDPKGCIGYAYATRIRALGPKSSRADVGSGAYTTDPPIELPRGASADLARKFLMARGYRQDEIDVENLGSRGGKLSGFGLWANGHECGFEATESEMKRTGSRFQAFDTPTDRNENYSVAFVVTPQVVIRAGGAKQFQCGARGGWSDVYYRQPDDLLASAKALGGVQK